MGVIDEAVPSRPAVLARVGVGATLHGAARAGRRRGIATYVFLPGASLDLALRE